jgi:hypothetical protein
MDYLFQKKFLLQNFTKPVPSDKKVLKLTKGQFLAEIFHLAQDNYAGIIFEELRRREK